LTSGLQRVKIAAVGPIIKEKLASKKVCVDIVPEQGFVMKNLVQHIKRALSR
jgi:uroporphyrinogen-III synthase